MTAVSIVEAWADKESKKLVSKSGGPLQARNRLVDYKGKSKLNSTNEFNAGETMTRSLSMTI